MFTQHFLSPHHRVARSLAQSLVKTINITNCYYRHSPCRIIERVKLVRVIIYFEENFHHKLAKDYRDHLEKEFLLVFQLICFLHQ